MELSGQTNEDGLSLGKSVFALTLACLHLSMNTDFSSNVQSPFSKEKFIIQPKFI